MAYVPSFEHDLFISYAHADNSTGRVTAFHRQLILGLTDRLGARAFHNPQEWIFYDQSILEPGDMLSPRIERSARRSAVMISLLSRSYLQAPWCICESECFLDSQRLARDRIERRLIPLVLSFASEQEMSQFPQFNQDRLRASLCSRDSVMEPGTPEWNRVLTDLCNQVADHLNSARCQHGSVYVGQICCAAEQLRSDLIEELRGFRCIPETAIFAQSDPEPVIRPALAQAKLALHFLGDTDGEAATSAEAITWSLDQCPGKTVGYLPPGRQLSETERQLLDAIKTNPAWAAKWTQPQCTTTELAQILTRELECFRLPDPATPIALACDQADLSTVQNLAREICRSEPDAFLIETPDFLAQPGTLAFIGWKKLLTKNKSVIVYWGQGRKEYLDTNVNRYLPAARLGRAWYVCLTEPDVDRKRGWQPTDQETEKIEDETLPFSYERLRNFLVRVRERARQ